VTPSRPAAQAIGELVTAILARSPSSPSERLTNVALPYGLYPGLTKAVNRIVDDGVVSSTRRIT